jgi:hypothetical protein
MIAWTEVPPIFFKDTQHYLSPNTIKQTACGILYEGEDWTIERPKDAKHICWQCIIVGALHEDIKQLMKVFEAASAWVEDPDSGSRRGALAAAVENYRNFMEEDIEFE